MANKAAIVLVSLRLFDCTLVEKQAARRYLLESSSFVVTDDDGLDDIASASWIAQTLLAMR
jgi:hypothetical protein